MVRAYCLIQAVIVVGAAGSQSCVQAIEPSRQHRLRETTLEADVSKSQERLGGKKGVKIMLLGLRKNDEISARFWVCQRLPFPTQCSA